MTPYVVLENKRKEDAEKAFECSQGEHSNVLQPLFLRLILSSPEVVKHLFLLFSGEFWILPSNFDTVLAGRILTRKLFIPFEGILDSL